MPKTTKPAKADKLTSKEVFVVYNNHVEDCGVPPKITNRDRARKEGEYGNYYGYFENGYGEQFIFAYDFDKESGSVWGGDCGWSKRLTVLELSGEKLKAMLRENFPDFTEKQLKVAAGDCVLENGNLLTVGTGKGALFLSKDEMTWVKACWETCQTYRRQRDARRADKAKKK